MKVSRLLGFALFLSSSIAFTNAALADDNCKQVIDGLKAQYATPPFVLEIGSCPNFNLTPDVGMIDARVQCVRVGEQGAWGFPDVRVVSNWWLFQHWPTYLGYCVGYKGTPPPMDPATADAMRKQLDELRGQLKR